MLTFKTDFRTLELAYFLWSDTVTDFEAAFAPLAQAGVRNVVVNVKRGNFDFSLRRDAEQARRILDRLGLAATGCHGLCNGPCLLTEDDPPTRDLMLSGHLNFMEHASLLGCRTYVLHIGCHAEQESSAAAWDRVRAALDQLAPRAEALGLLLALENGFTPGYLGRSAQELLDFVTDYADPAVGICYDSGHAHLMEGAVPALATLAPEVVTVHLHDNAGTSDDHLLPGQGTLDWPPVMALLRTCPRLVNLETEAANSEGWAPSRGRVVPLEEALAAYQRLLR